MTITTRRLVIQACVFAVIALVTGLLAYGRYTAEERSHATYVEMPVEPAVSRLARERCVNTDIEGVRCVVCSGYNGIQAVSCDWTSQR